MGLGNSEAQNENLTASARGGPAGNLNNVDQLLRTSPSGLIQRAFSLIGNCSQYGKSLQKDAPARFSQDDPQTYAQILWISGPLFYRFENVDVDYCT
jgi:rRNA maturation protein Nop10